jgi:cbb3-type cytochrome oxidase maturation protein
VINISRGYDTGYLLTELARIFLRLINKYMSVIVILLIASISVAFLFLVAFLWSVQSGQYEDDSSPASRILFDDKPSSGTDTKNL